MAKAKDPGNLDQTVREAMLRQIRVDIGLLSNESTLEQIAAIVERMAASGLDELTRDHLLKTINAQTKTTIKVLEKQLSAALKQRRTSGRPQGLILNAFGEPVALEANAVVIIRQKLDRLFALDEFKQVPMIMSRPPWGRRGETYPRPMTDGDDAALLAWVQLEGIHLHGRSPIKTVMAQIIGDYTFHPVIDYLDSLKWDGVPRLDRWPISYLCAIDIPNYTTIVAAKWMMSAAARIYQPGCMAKYCFLLLGPQDLGKSEVFNILGGEWYSDDMAELGTKDAAMQNAGVWIVELSELASTYKAHIDASKSFISRKVDRFRPPYGTHVQERPRHSVLCGTVNPNGAFLKDETGNVRFWPVTCTAIDFDALRRDRDQLWAETVHRYKAGEHWWLEDDDAIEAAREVQGAHSETAEDYPWYSVIEHWLKDEEKLVYGSYPIPKSRLRKSDNSFVFPIAEVLERLTIPKERWGETRVLLPIGKILRQLGWISSGVRLASFEDGRKDQPVRCWQKNGNTCDHRLDDGYRCGHPVTPPATNRCPDHLEEMAP